MRKKNAKNGAPLGNLHVTQTKEGSKRYWKGDWDFPPGCDG